MSDHWQTIEIVLEDERDRHIRNGGLAANRKDIDAALAFVREQKAAAWEPLPDDIEIQDTERNTWLSVERGGALISMSQHDTEDDPIAHDLFEVGLPPSVRLCRKQGGDA
jgi:hypothetical protein